MWLVMSQYGINDIKYNNIKNQLMTRLDHAVRDHAARPAGYSNHLLVYSWPGGA